MRREFSITGGLESMGPLRTGGQGSVYKGRRKGEVFSAVKLLPTPIFTRDNDDKNFRDFQNEVLKLKKVNEEPNPHVVKILSSGLTDSGGFPFIEMEYIDGPDLEELIKLPHDPIFTIKEAIKLASQLASALAHCHKAGVKHGDIKSNNIKLDVHSRNYILLDFGLAVMSDEQRRTSLRYAGAIEFMAPEQSEGMMLFESDIYSFGIILFELLAGRVPFPLMGNSETARNMVMISHLETPVPDLLTLRRENIPETWSEEMKEQEMLVPFWLLNVISRCLEKKPENRYKDGVELNEVITLNSVTDSVNPEISAGILKLENERLDTLLMNYKRTLSTLDIKINSIKQMISAAESEISAGSNDSVAFTRHHGVRLPKTVFAALLILILSLSALMGYSLFQKSDSSHSRVTGLPSAEKPVESQSSTFQNASLPAESKSLDSYETKKEAPSPGVVREPSVKSAKSEPEEKRLRRKQEREERRAEKDQKKKRKFIEVKFY